MAGILQDLARSFGFCLHPADCQIRRRNDAGVMGFECLACSRWTPLKTPLSALGRQLNRQQRKAQKASALTEESKEQRQQRKNGAPVVIPIRKAK